MLRRVDDTHGTWQMPQVCHACVLSLLAADGICESACMQIQGGIDALENPFAAATRELLEETGISSVTFLAQVSIAIESLRYRSCMLYACVRHSFLWCSDRRMAAI